MAPLTPQGDAFTQLVLEVFRINGRLLEAGDQLAKPVGLRSARWQVLGVVEHRPISVAHVAHEMGLTRQSVQQTADGLEKHGFITFVDNPHHRRSKLMQLTPKGQTALDFIKGRQAEWANALGEHFAAEDMHAVVRALRQIHERLAAQPTETHTPTVDPQSK